MKKYLFLTLFTGFILILVACGDNTAETSPNHEQIISNGRECIAVEGNNSMDDFFSTNHVEDDFDDFFSNQIDNYAGLYFDSGIYVILFADQLENWQTPEMLGDVRFRVCQVENSYNELAAVRTQINNNHGAASVLVTSWGIDTLENRIVVYLADLTDESILDFKENVSDSPLIDLRQEGRAVFYATILEMFDEPQADWYGDQMTVLVTSEEHGRMVFDHRRLEEIGAIVGDVVEITITGVWVQPDPAPVSPDSWRLVD